MRPLYPPLRQLLRRVHRQEGFGLIEMMIALTMLAIASVSLTGVFVTGHITLRRATQSDSAAVIADRLLERFRAEKWDDIALNASLVAGADSVYTGDSAYSGGLGQITYDPTNPDQSLNGAPNATSCNDDPVPIACNPSREIPYSDSSFSEVAPDGRKYRVDTYITWGCPNSGSSSETLGGTLADPTCTLDSTGVEQPYSAIKVVTIVVRDDSSATTLAAAPVYRTSTTFDRLIGGSMPDVTSEATGDGTTTTTDSGDSGPVPDPAASVVLANGGGAGSAYVDLGNVTSLSFDVSLPASSAATNTVNLSISDGNSAHDIARTASATDGAGLVHFTGINGQALSDGNVTVTVTVSNNAGTSSATTLTVSKDTSAPAPPTGVTFTNGQGDGNAYVNNSTKSSAAFSVTVGASSASTDTVSLTLGDGTTTTSAVTAAAPTGAGSVSMPSLDASSLSDGTLTASATAVDTAGNASTAATVTVKKDVTATLSGVAYTDKSNSTADRIGGTSETGATLTITETQPSSATFGPTMLASTTFDVAVAAIQGSQQNQKSYSYTVKVTDKAGNTKQVVLADKDTK